MLVIDEYIIKAWCGLFGVARLCCPLACTLLRSDRKTAVFSLELFGVVRILLMTYTSAL